MKPQKQPIEVNFSGGLDTKTDSKQVIAGKFLTLQNSVFDTAGLLKKRNGYASLGSSITSPPGGLPNYPAFGANVTNGALVAPYNSELVVGDGLNLYSYTKAANAMSYKGRAALNSHTETSIFQNEYDNILSDCAVNTTTGYSLYAWEYWSRQPQLNGQFNNSNYSLFDTSTGQQILNSFVLGSRPKCVSIGSNLFLIYLDVITGHLIGLPVTIAGAGAPVTLVSNISASKPNYDVIVNNSNIYIGYNGTSSTVKVASFNSSLASVATISKSETATNGIGLFADTSNNVWVAYNNASATKAFIVNSALSVTVLAPTVVDNTSQALNVSNVTGVYDGTQGIIFYDQQGAPAVGQVSTITTSGDFTQPAVGSAVTVSFNHDPLQYLEQIINIAGGGWYYVQTYIMGQLSLKNLGYPGSAAPGANVVSGSALSPVAGNINATISFNTLTAGGIAGTQGTFINSCALNSKAFLFNGIAHVIGSYDSLIQPTYFLFSCYNISGAVGTGFANASIKIFEGEAGGIPYKSILPNVNIDAGGNYVVALPKRTIVISNTQQDSEFLFYYNGIFSVSINMSPTQVMQQGLGKSLLIGSGNVLSYDGQQVVEQGFNIFPENLTATPTSGGLMTASAAYGYVAVYEWIDANGQVNRSAPSAVLSVTVPPMTDQSFNVTIPTLRITEKPNATIAIYRTAANGSIHYRIDTSFGTDYPILNLMTQNTIVINDILGDSQIIGNEQLYTDGEVENISPPASGVLSNFRNRAIAAPFDDSNSFWYSKQIIPGSPVEFSDLFVQNVNSVGGNLITVAPMDDKLVIYKGTNVYYMVGEGPASSGANNDFTDPLLITTDCGAVDKNSVVAMPLGHMFKSDKGIYLLDRGLNATYLGAEVEQYNQYNVLSSTLIKNNNQVRFALSSGDVLMYDYFYKQWSVFTGLSPVSACIFQDQYTYIKSDGTVWQETPGVYVDGTNHILMSFTTAWIKLAGLQGYQRAYFFYLLGEYISANSLTLNISYDYDGTIVQSPTFVPATTPVLHERVFLQTQRCQAIQLNLQENYTSANGAGITLSAIQFIVGIKSAFRPTPAANTIS